jgi:hypothetical protein
MWRLEKTERAKTCWMSEIVNSVVGSQKLDFRDGGKW